MEADSRRIYDLEKTIVEKRSYRVSDNGNIPVPVWVRRVVQSATGLDRVLLDYGLNPVLWIGSVFWLIFIVKEIIK